MCTHNMDMLCYTCMCFVGKQINCNILQTSRFECVFYVETHFYIKISFIKSVPNNSDIMLSFTEVNPGLPLFTTVAIDKLHHGHKKRVNLISIKVILVLYLISFDFFHDSCVLRRL